MDSRTSIFLFVFLIPIFQVEYKELILDESHELTIEPFQNDQIIRLVIQYPTNVLAIILGILVGIVIILSTFCIGGLVFVKIQTDKLIESHNANLTTINLRPDSPIQVKPYNEKKSCKNQKIDSNSSSNTSVNVADTVVFGKY